MLLPSEYIMWIKCKRNWTKYPCMPDYSLGSIKCWECLLCFGTLTVPLPAALSFATTSLYGNVLSPHIFLQHWTNFSSQHMHYFHAWSSIHNAVFKLNCSLKNSTDIWVRFSESAGSQMGGRWHQTCGGIHIFLFCFRICH
jgi:hypothetical protein